MTQSRDNLRRYQIQKNEVPAIAEILLRAGPGVTSDCPDVAYEIDPGSGQIDEHNYRVAFIEAFRKWGIYPRKLRPLSAAIAALIVRRRARSEGERPAMLWRNRSTMLRTSRDTAQIA